ncbi:hypothetical protein AB0G32_35590, partial [Streptomyces sp. NPDC023723]
CPVPPPPDFSTATTPGCPDPPLVRTQRPAPGARRSGPGRARPLRGTDRAHRHGLAVHRPAAVTGHRFGEDRRQPPVCGHHAAGAPPDGGTGGGLGGDGARCTGVGVSGSTEQ